MPRSAAHTGRAPVLPLRPDAQDTLPPAREDRRAIRTAVRGRRLREAAERHRVGVRRPRLIVGGAAVGLVLLIGLPLLLAFGPVFPVRTIAVSGASAPLAAQVREALRAELGRPVALVEQEDVTRALSTVPAVERFTLVRRPPGTLEVTVVPRTPVAQERTDTGWAVLDAARVRIAVDRRQSAVLPVVTIPEGTARPGQAYATAVSAVRALDGISPDVVAVRASTADDVVLTLRSGVRVRWGGAEDGAAKTEALVAALRKAARGASLIDVSSPGVVLTR